MVRARPSKLCLTPSQQVLGQSLIVPEDVDLVTMLRAIRADRGFHWTALREILKGRALETKRRVGREGWNIYRPILESRMARLETMIRITNDCHRVGLARARVEHPLLDTLGDFQRHLGFEMDQDRHMRELILRSHGELSAFNAIWQAKYFTWQMEDLFQPYPRLNGL